MRRFAAHPLGDADHGRPAWSSPTPAITLAWKEPVSADLQRAPAGGRPGSARRRSSRDSWPTRRSPAFRDRRGADAERRARRLAPIYANKITDGEAIGRIRDARASASTTWSSRAPTPPTCRRDPATTRRPALPGQGKTIGIAGHRTTYLAPFRQINEIETATRSRSRCPTGRSSTRCERPRSSTRRETDVVDDVGSRAPGAHRLSPALQRRRSDTPSSRT